MGRGRGGGGGRRAPPPARRGGGLAQRSNSSGQPSLLGSMAGTMMQGFAFGTGSSLARSAVDSVMGGGSSAPVEQQQQQPQMQQQQSPLMNMSNTACSFDQEAFMQCLNENKGSVQSCEFYYNALQQCQQQKM